MEIRNYLLRNINPSFVFPVLWVIISTVLLTIPASAFPKENWLGKIWLDKWVHVGMFAIMVILWSWAMLRMNFNKQKLKRIFIWISIIGLSYGIGMEYVQKHFVANRSFDTGDIIADAVGCLAGLLFCMRRYIKKLTPVETGVATKTNCL